MTAITPDQQRALAIARELAALGMPMFVAPPDPTHWSGTGYALPVGWQRSPADSQVVDTWQPGWALCGVTGVVLDLIDVDLRNGGQLTDVTKVLPAMAIAYTPSNGYHVFVPPLGVASRDGAWQGVDVKSGTKDGHGRGFAFLAPTVRVSKVDGQPRAYQWDPHTDIRALAHGLETVRQYGNTGVDTVRAHIEALRAARPANSAPRRIPMSVARNEWDRAVRKLTADVAHWARYGWGGQAHAGLLAATTHLARLHTEAAPGAFHAAFRAAGLEPDEQDLRKLETALSAAVPDIVVPDHEMPTQELFWAGAVIPEDRTGSSPPGRGTGPGMAPLGVSGAQGGHIFAPVSRERFRDRPAPRTPTLGAFGGAHGLFYDSGVHWLQGESESGKSWVAQALIAELLRAGLRVLYVDYEDTEASVLGRFGALGVTEDQIEGLTYVPGDDVLFTELADHVRTTSYAAVVVDGVTSALNQFGAKMNDAQEVTAWVNALPARARMSVCVDHVTKATDDRNGMAIGTQAKKSVVTGTAWEVVCPPSGKFGQGQNGFIVLQVQKDKPGGVRAQVGHKSVVLRVLTDGLLGTVRLAAKRTEAVAEAEAVDEAARRATELREAEEMYLAISEQCNVGDSQRKVTAWAIGSEAERRMAGGKNAETPPGAHPGWKEHVLRSVWRVWTHISIGPRGATLDNQLQHDLHALVTGIPTTGVSDLEKRPLTPSDQHGNNGHARKDLNDLGTKGNTQFWQTSFDQGKRV